MKSENVKTNRREVCAKGFGMFALGVLHVRLAVFFSLLVFSFSLSTVHAQPESSDDAPPPLKAISKDERTKLEAVTDIKEHTKLALDLMESRMKLAETALTGEDFDAVYHELGGFHYLMDNTLDFLNRRDNDSGTIRNNFKRYELALRAFAPRLELIRREVPTRYEPYIFKLLKYLREARTKAIEPLFGSTASSQKLAFFAEARTLVRA